MKTVKVKNIFFGLLTIAALSTMFVACQQDALEDLTPTTEKQLTEIEDRNFDNLATDIIGTWRHSHEENTDPTVASVYRPYGFDFPPSRGRNGFRFSPNGNFVYLYPGPADEPLQVEGTWRIVGTSSILVSVPVTIDGPSIPRLPIIKVLSIDSGKLVVKPVNWY